MLKTLLVLLGSCVLLTAQIITGRLEGTMFSPDGQPRPDEDFEIIGGTGVAFKLHTDSQGRFALILPYGLYRMGGYSVQVAPLVITRVDIVPNPIAIPALDRPTVGGPTVPPQPHSLQGSLTILDPAAVSEPVNFTGRAVYSELESTVEA